MKTTIRAMNWVKQGLVYCPDGTVDWAREYAFPPTPFMIAENRLRIFLSFCDKHTVGRAGYVDVDPTDPNRILSVSKKPILDVGKAGMFDENGVVPTSVIAVGNQLYMYYVGYQLGQKVRYYQFEGLAVSDNNGESFQRIQEVPVIDRSDREALNRTSAFVMAENGIFRMWYVGGSEWTEVNGKTLPVYNLRYAESVDGIHWPTSGNVCIDFKSKDEHALGRPWVIKNGSLYKMFFSSRTYSKGYRIGYAESSDGITWRRLDETVGINVSETGWDSQMIAYPSIFNWEHQTYMFYNGNDCGRTGFGYAVLTS
jgi:predicted GH43/DUF377 family glycosyl hydrolase